MFSKKIIRICGAQPNVLEYKKISWKTTANVNSGGNLIHFHLSRCDTLIAHAVIQAMININQAYTVWITMNINQKAPNSVSCCVIAHEQGFQANAMPNQLLRTNYCYLFQASSISWLILRECAMR